jgi:hypothetical protein
MKRGNPDPRHRTFSPHWDLYPEGGIPDSVSRIPSPSLIQLRRTNTAGFSGGHVSNLAPGTFRFDFVPYPGKKAIWHVEQNHQDDEREY